MAGSSVTAASDRVRRLPNPVLMLRLRSPCAVCLLSAVVVVGGCGEPRPPVAGAAGKITFNGNPASAGRVLFLPADGGKQGLARIRPDGTFTLRTFAADDGAIVGQHHVVIVDVTLDATGDKTHTFAAAEGKPLTVEADKENHFDIELNSPNWKHQTED